MAYDNYSSSGAAPVRARSNEPMDGASEEAPLSSMPPLEPAPQNLPDIPLPPSAPQLRAGVSDDLLVPWGWLEVALFVILAVIASVVVTWGVAEVAVRFFGVKPDNVFGTTMSTAKSVVVLMSQALIDGFAILYLYLMLLGRTRAPFWQSIGWRDMYTASGKLRPSSLQFLAGGAVLAVVVSFAGGFLNSKETLRFLPGVQAGRREIGVQGGRRHRDKPFTEGGDRRGLVGDRGRRARRRGPRVLGGLQGLHAGRFHREWPGPFQAVLGAGAYPHGRGARGYRSDSHRLPDKPPDPESDADFGEAHRAGRRGEASRIDDS